MRVTTRDPVSGNGITGRETGPVVIEGSGEAALKIHFESGHNRQEYLKILPRRPAAR